MSGGGRDSHRPGIDVSFQALVDLRHAARGAAAWSSRADSRSGGRSGRRRGRGHDIRDLRPYTEGDDLRHVDAAATARSGRTQVRTFQEEQDSVALLVADFRSPMCWGTARRLRSVAAAEALALAGWQIVAQGGSVGALVATDDRLDYLAPRARDTAMVRIAGLFERAHGQALAAGLPSGAPRTLDRILLRAARLVRRGAAVICATGLDDPGADFDQAVAAARQRVQLRILAVRDAVESRPPSSELPVADGTGTVRWARFLARGTSAGGPSDTPGQILERVRVAMIDIDAGADRIALASPAEARP